MSEAMNIFMNSYLKKMKRPEMGEGFSPDQAFGANMVRGSESLNPDSLRDRTNAQYGGMKGPSYQGPGVNIPGMGSVQNMPFMGANKDTPFAGMMNQTAKVVGPNIISPWLTDKFMNWLKEGKTKADISAISSSGGELTIPKGSFVGDVAPGLSTVEDVSAMASGGPVTIPAGMEVKDIAPTLKDIGDVGEVIKSAPSNIGLGATASAAGPMMELLTGSKTAGRAASAAATTGLAAAQGFANPMSDLAAVMSLYKLIRGLF